MNLTSKRNPFTVTSPEGLSAKDVNDLFVDVFTDFYKVREVGHSILNGPRGCGKSMMFRHMEPDCQCIWKNCGINDLNFFAILISLKNHELNLTELRRLQPHHFNVVFNEHFLTSYIASKVFSYLSSLNLGSGESFLTVVSSYTNIIVEVYLRRAGMDRNRVTEILGNRKLEGFLLLSALFEDMFIESLQYIRRISLPGSELPSYSGPLCGYLDLLFPVLSELSKLSFMPQAPIYLLLDDADVLNITQTKILNSWLSTRTSAQVSLKLSTQNRYKTLAKVTGGIVESPHDFSEVDIIDVYTTKKGRYLSRVHDIIAKRLKSCGYHCTPDEFFPSYELQELAIKQIESEIREGNHKVSGRGYRISDDVLRYARPIYMSQLAGTAKSSSKYVYAGFEQLVHISSGLIRFFLDPAALMYSEQQATTGEVNVIDPMVQNSEIRKMSESLMTSEFDRLELVDEQGESQTENVDFATKSEDLRTLPLHTRQKLLMRNIIEVLGGTFRQKLLSEDSERRVFSVAFTDTPSIEVVQILDLGVQYGYFQRTTIGNKDGTGRTPLYILTRRLAPFFTLDPSGFAGYLFVSSERLKDAMYNPSKTLRRVRDKGASFQFGEERQLRLFEDGEIL